jgi:hypothetical protein
MRRVAVLGVLTVLSVVGTGCSADLQDEDTQARLTQLGATALAQDFRVVFHLERDATICGGTGDYLSAKSK